MKLYNEQDMLDYGASFAATLLKDGPLSIVIELIGDVGAGKTTFVRGLAQGLGIRKSLTSPSYTISRSYAFTSLDGEPHILDHYDFYRLSDPGLMSETLSESVRAGHLVIVEWADSVKDILPGNRISIQIQLCDDNTRDLTFLKHPSNNPSELSMAEKPTPTPTPTARNHYPSHSSRISLYLDTSTPTTILRLNDQEYTWLSENRLAEKIFQFIHEKLHTLHADWHDISEITFMSGPGSFTGLRIGATVVNTIAHELNIPLYDHHGKKHPIILPDYGRPAHITSPKK